MEGIEGGEAPYQYILNSQTSNNTGVFNPLSPGIYNLEITDANGCQLDTSFVVHPGVDLSLSVLAEIELLDAWLRLRFSYLFALN